MSKNIRILILSILTVLVFVLSFSTHNVAATTTPIIELDKTVYTWTDRVNITVIAPDQNLDPNAIDTIGNTDTSKITISDRGNSITSYKLVETGPNTGIFTGYVILTGDSNLKGSAGVDGNGTNPTGLGPSGTGPADGLLPAEDSDGISVTFQTPDQTVTASARMIWNVGQISWLTPDHTTGSKILQIIDPDMSLNPNTVDTFFTQVWSSSDLGGVLIPMTETGSNTGIFQGTVYFTNSTSSGNKLHVSGGNNTITGQYNDRTLPAPFTPNDADRFNATTFVINSPQATPTHVVKLDKKSYTWTDKVGITVTAPDQNRNHNTIDTIGNTGTSKITISDRGHTITSYKLVETGPNTGIFTGYVILTGKTTIKDIGGVDGEGQEPTGLGPSGIGPTDGLLPAEDSDGISVTFQTPDQTVVSSAPIAWQIGSVTWLQPNYPSDGQGVLQIIDQDMNLSPNAVDKFDTNVWSDSDSGGIKLAMTETGKNTGIFQGVVVFTNSASSGNKLHVATGDTVTGEYKDRTLPLPYTPADQLRLTATTLIQVPSIILNPSSGPLGTVVKVTGSGFASSSEILIMFDSINVTSSLHPKTDSRGDISTTFTVPRSVDGSHSITVTDSALTPNSVSASFFKTYPTIFLSQSSGLPGTTVTITGFNFTPSHTIRITDDGDLLATTPTAKSNASGNFTVTFKVPLSDEIGINAITASDGINHSYAIFTIINRVFLNDKFDTDISGWQHYGYPGYTVSLDTTEGQLAPSAHISGDTYLGICSNHGMAKSIDISNYSGGPLTLTFNWRASSTSNGAGLTTQAEVRVDNADTGAHLFTHRLVNSGAIDTGWQFYSTDISSYVSGTTRIQVDLYLYDCWAFDWGENNWYDNIKLYQGTTPP